MTVAEVMAAQDGEEAISINRHFVEHPDMVLGSHARTSSAYGPTYTCLPVRPEPDALFQDLLAALHTLPADIYAAPTPARLERETLIDETIRVGTAADGATIKEGSYLVVKDKLAQIVDGMPSPLRSATARARTAYRRGMRALSGASFRFATPFVKSCAPKKLISPGAAPRFGCARPTHISSGSSARST